MGSITAKKVTGPVQKIFNGTETTFVGTNYNDSVTGNALANTIGGGNGDDLIRGGAGDDVLWGDSFSNSDANDNGQDTIYGDSGKDKVHGGNGKDLVDGGDDNDFVYGENGVDDVRGGTGSDFLFGGNGDDALLGGLGGGSMFAEDVLTGGLGADRFIFTTTSTNVVTDSIYTIGAPGTIVGSGELATWSKPWDVVTDFTHNEDKIDLSQLAATANHALVWRGAHGNDAAAGAAEPGLAYGVWTDSAGAFLYADIDGDGQADMKVQVSNAGEGDFIGVTYDKQLNAALSITDDDTDPNDGEGDDDLCLGDLTGLVTISFGELVLGFDIGDLSATGGTLSGLTDMGGGTYTVTFTAAADYEGNGTVTLAAGNDVVDWSGNSATVTQTAQIEIDTLPPTVTIDIGDGSDDVINIAENGAGVTVTLTFSEKVHSLDPAQISVTAGATLGAFTLAADGLSATATLTIQEASLTSVDVTVGAGAFGDECDNPSVANNAATDVDLAGPVVNSIDFDASELCPDHGLSTTVTITFDQAVEDFDNDDVTVTGGTLSDLESVDGIVWTATFAAAADFEGAGSVVVNAGGYTDNHGNPGAASDASNPAIETVEVDTLAPVIESATIEDGADDIINIAESSATVAVRVTFNGAVVLADETLITTTTGSTLAAFILDLDGLGGTAYLSIQDPSLTSVTVTIADGAFTDDCGNAVTGTTASAGVDLSAPTVTIAIVDTDLNDTDTNSLVTIEFSEAPTGFVEADLAVTGGSLSDFTQVDATHFTATFTATDGYDSDDGTLPDGAGVTLGAGTYTDAAGNAGAAGGDTVNVDRINPTVTSMTASPTTLTDAAFTATVTIVFSEAISAASLALTDFSAAHGAFSNLSGSGTTWTLTYTASDGYDGGDTLALDGAYTDLAGNAGSGASTGVTIDRFEDAPPPPPQPQVARIEFVPNPDFDHNGQGVGAFGQFFAYDADGNLIANPFTAGALSAKVSLAADGVITALNPINDNDDLNFTLFGQDVQVILGGGNGETLSGSSDAILIMFGYGGGDTLNGGGEGDTLFGGSNNANNSVDILLGGIGNDWLFGGSGDDRLTGGGGADHLNGGADADRFIYTATGDSTLALSDVISDFSVTADVIDLSAIDAIAGGGDQAFLGFTNSSTVTANSVNWFTSGGNTYVQGDVTGDGTADFSIMLEGQLALAASNVTL